MCRFKSLLIGALLAGVASGYATPPIEYYAAVRDDRGRLEANQTVALSLQITDAPVDGNVLYGEIHETQTDDVGMALLMIGQGTPTSGNYDLVDWSAPRYLQVNLTKAGGKTPRLLGTIQLLGAPTTMTAQTATKVSRTNASNQIETLTVDNFGNLTWKTEQTTGDPAYDPELVPENLYFIGTFNNWKIAEAVAMEKLSNTKFAITRRLTRDEIFKFTSKRAWDAERDWSGQSCNIGEPNPMREFGNTPAFSGPDGTYQIVVDFYTYTLTITPK